MGEGTKKRAAKARGDFFGVDVATFQAVCALGNADYCAAYLVIAAGTDGGNRVTSWSREAINQRTAMTWRKARDFVEAMVEQGFLRWVRKGARPRLELLYLEERQEPSPAVAALMQRIADREDIPDDAPTRKTLGRAIRDGLIEEDGQGGHRLAKRHKLAWLPKSLVEWNGSNRPPVERIRKGQDAGAFRLLIDIYSQQDLAEEGGLSVFDCYQTWEDRSEFAHTGQFKVWEFSDRKLYVRETGPIAHHYREPTLEEKGEGKGRAVDAFARLELLQDAGVLEWVYYLAESDDARPNLIHPVAVVRHGKVDHDAIETTIGKFAQRAGLALAGIECAAEAAGYEDEWPWRFILPAERVLRRVQLVAVLRTRYRSKTRNAARWQKRLHGEAPAYIEEFSAIIEDHAPALKPADFPEVADFNESSTLTSTLVQRDLNDSDKSTMHPVAA